MLLNCSKNKISQFYLQKLLLLKLLFLSQKRISDYVQHPFSHTTIIYLPRLHVPNMKRKCSNMNQSSSSDCIFGVSTPTSDSNTGTACCHYRYQQCCDTATSRYPTFAQAHLSLARHHCNAHLQHGGGF